MGKRIKIYCHSCKGQGYILENRFPDTKPVRVVCPECNGEKFVWDELYDKEDYRSE